MMSRGSEQTPSEPNKEAKLKVELYYKPPFAWDELLGFFQAHRLKGVDKVENGAYLRTLAVEGLKGWLRVSHPGEGQVTLEVSADLEPAIEQIIKKVRGLLDLDASVHLADAFLKQDPRFSASISLKPGLRLPGCIDIFELAWRTILGQQVSVQVASAIGSKTIERLADPITTPFEGLSYLSLTPKQLMEVDTNILGELGWIRSRQAAVQALAKAAFLEELSLSRRQDPEEMVTTLLKFPGIGPWTANYIAMRGLNWADGWPYNDGVLRKRMGGAKEPNPAWSPWRAYAAMRLWYP